MKSQLKPTLARLHTMVVAISALVLPTPSRNCLNEKKSITQGMLYASMR